MKQSPLTSVTHDQMANAIRALSMDAVEKAKSGHPGMPMGMADVATVLFTEFLNIDPKHPEWPNRDRFILSAGHGSMLQYALHYLMGYEDMTLEQIKNFRQWGAKTAGHPEYGHAQGIETTTGPLGQGIANSVGFALAERLLNAEFGDAVNHYTYVIAGDGCLMEGISLEAASLAGHLKLNKLIVLFDDNGISIDGPTSLAISDDHCKRFEAQGWNTQSIDGHDAAEIRAAILKAQKSDKPTLIACKTVIAKGAPTKAGKNSSHGSPLGDEEIAGARKNLDWSYAPFEIPDDILSAWRDAAKRGAAEYAAWEKKFAALPKDTQSEFSARMAGDLGDAWVKAMDEFKRALAESQPKEATRQSSQNVLEAIVPHAPALLGGSADLTGSNNTKTKPMKGVTASDFSGRYIYYGVREHGMAAAMNGIALHGGFVPYSGTFLVFTDYCRPSIRLSALMQQRVIYVMTHDSIGLGEDGPTHQPVEHVASLRAMPNVNVFRPADAMETAECWALSIASRETPSVLALSRQAVPALRTEYTKDNLCAKGAYILREASTAPQVVLIGTGTELHLCTEAQTKLEEKGVSTRVVSMPCMDLFAAQPKRYQEQVLGGNALRIAVEAGIGFGWERWIGENGVFIGMQGFGASAPAPELYKQFGITVDAIVKAAENA
ncbi:MAG: transketolase [Alphaproteobacteria bacterium]|nr:transketolase [Alphaproteobacteria bacterium]